MESCIFSSNNIKKLLREIANVFVIRLDVTEIILKLALRTQLLFQHKKPSGFTEGFVI